MLARHMDAQLLQFIRQADFDRASVQYVAERLPADDAELAREIERTAARLEEREFRYLSLAALVAGRRVDARHLVGSISMLAKTEWLAEVALRMQGANFSLRDCSRHFTPRPSRRKSLRSLQHGALNIVTVISQVN